MRKVITGEQMAQLYNRDPFALPAWRAPIYQTPAGFILAVQLARLRGTAATATTEERRRVLRLLVKDVLIGPEKITIRHRIPVRERATSGGGHHDTTDTEGDMRPSYELCWGRDR